MSYGIIYRVTNLINSKIYIGQTVTSMTTRKNGHLSNARKNVLDIPFHRAIRKYGEESFVWEIIDVAWNKEDLNKKEKYWIATYDSTNKSKGYNATIGGDAFGGKGEDNFWFGKERTEENKAKISKTLKETRRKKGSPRNIPIVQLSINGEFVAEYKNTIETEFNKKAINACCRGRQVSCSGYLWLYKDNYNDEFVKSLVERYQDRKGGADKSVVSLDLNGIFVKEYKSIEDAVSEVGGFGSNITACCRGRQKTYKGYMWVYKKDYIS